MFSRTYFASLYMRVSLSDYYRLTSLQAQIQFSYCSGEGGKSSHFIRPGQDIHPLSVRLFVKNTLCKSRNDFVEVADDAVGGDFEDRGFGVFVDRYDGVGRLHSDEVLHRT